MARRKASSPENEFIARDEAKRRELKQLKQQQAEAEAARQERIGTCPCGCESKLVPEDFRDLTIDRCRSCGGVWLDPGELEKIATDDASVVRNFLDFFRGTSE